MKSLKTFAGSLLVAVAVVAGCRGTVDRAYFDDLAGPEAGVDGSSTSSSTSSTSSTSSSSSSSGDSGSGKERDASDDGPPPITAPASIKGTVVGLVGAGLVLQNNGGDDLSITTGGAFEFETQLAPNQPYDVTVKSQPEGPTQTCTVERGTGTAKGVDVTDVAVTCTTNAYPVSVNVTGLETGRTVVLTNNGGNDLTITQNGTSTFANDVPSGGNFNVLVKTQPGGGNNCTISGGSGQVVTSAVDSVVVNCTPGTFTVGGSVSGLAGSVVITSHGVDRTISSNGAFAFPPITNGTNYNVTVKTQPAYPPATQTCAVATGTGSGTVNGANVTSVQINCTTTQYTVGGTVNGLTGTGLVLRNNGGNNRSITTNGSFSFSNAIASGATYAVTVFTQPTGQTCSVATGTGTGTVQSANVTSVVVSCAETQPLSENFDGVTAPTLPPGWTTASLLFGNSPWTVVAPSSNQRASAPNSAFINSTESRRDYVLVSPVFTVSSTTAKLSFWNRYRTEWDYDGGILEIKIADGPWQDIIDAGGSFTAGGYNGTLEEDNDSTLAGRPAWHGSGTVTTQANLPAAAANKSLQLRWRYASDNGYAEQGWWIDDVLVTN
ncbi:MAG: hypothetical protein KIT84_06550 [Labilithrix sp.]|nr:hypothetical protein [Labilithrix sp.]MCW5810652.1 hypothetical protein [Labilithrix sp.]